MVFIPSPVSTEPPLPRGWLVVGLLCVVGGLNYLDRIMITTMRSSIVAAIPMTDAQFGLLTAVFLWVYAALSPCAGFFADRFSRSRVIIASLLVWSVITWWTAHVTTYEQLLLTRALMGISEAFYLPAALALISDYHRGSTRSFATGVHMTGIMVGTGLGGVGGLIAERHGWGYPFGVFGMVGIVYAVVLLLVLRDAPAAKPATVTGGDAGRVRFVEALRSLFSRGAFRLAFVFWGLLGLAGWAIGGWMPTYFKEHFNLSQGVAGISATGYREIASIVGVLVGGAWADYWSRTNPRARILVPALGLCVAAVGLLTMANATLFSIGVAGLVTYGLTRTFTDANMMPILCLVCDSRYRATGYGVLNCFNCTIAGATVYFGGALRDAGGSLSSLYLTAAASLVVCAVLLFFMRPPGLPAAPQNSSPSAPGGSSR